MNLIKRHQTSLERKANPNNSFSIEKGTRGLFKEAWEYCAELEFESSQLSHISRIHLPCRNNSGRIKSRLIQKLEIPAPQTRSKYFPQG